MRTNPKAGLARPDDPSLAELGKAPSHRLRCKCNVPSERRVLPPRPSKNGAQPWAPEGWQNKWGVTEIHHRAPMAGKARPVKHNKGLVPVRAHATLAFSEQTRYRRSALHNFLNLSQDN